MAEQILFSVVIPTYNRSGRLKLALQSVLKQQYTNFEVLIIDDGGQDDTKEVVESFQDSRLKYFWKKNEERSIARNYGIFKATGHYVCFLDSDDLWHPDHLSHAASFINPQTTEVFHASFEYVNEKCETQNQVLVKEVTLEKLFEHNFLHGNAIFIKREIALTYHFLQSPFAILSEDHYVWLQLVAHCKFVCSEKVTSAVVEHEARSLNAINPDKAKRNYEVLFASLEQDAVLTSPQNLPGLQKLKASKYIFTALCYALQKNNAMAMKCLQIAVKNHAGFLAHYRFWAVVKKMALNVF